MSGRLSIVALSPQIGMAGGAETFSERLAHTVGARGHRYRVIAMDAAASRAVIADGFEIVRLSRSPWRRGIRRFGMTLFALRQAWWLLTNRSEIDVVLAHGFQFSEVFGVLVADLIGLPTMVKVASSGPQADYLLLRRPLLGRRLRRATDAIVVTSGLARRELEGMGVPGSKLFDIPNGVPAMSRRTRSAAVAPTVACVASLRRVKGHDVLLKAWSRVREQVPDAHLMLVGDGPEREQLERAASAMGGSVSLLGVRDDVIGLLADADIFVLPSRAEGMSNALLEAMAAGLPCVVTDVGANAEALGNDASHWVVDSEDADTLADRLTELLLDAGLRIQVGDRMYRRAAANYTIDVVAQRYIDLFTRLTGHEEDAQ